MTAPLRYVRTVDLEGQPVDLAATTGTTRPTGPPLVERIGLPSTLVDDEHVAGVLRRLEQLPPVTRREQVRARIRDREAELATMAEQHPRPDLTRLRVDDELLGGLHLVDLLPAA